MGSWLVSGLGSWLVSWLVSGLGSWLATVCNNVMWQLPLTVVTKTHLSDEALPPNVTNKVMKQVFRNSPQFLTLSFLRMSDVLVQ